MTVFFSLIFGKIVLPLLLFVWGFVKFVLAAFLAVFLYAMLKYKPPLKLTALNIRKLRRIPMKIKLFSFIRWKLLDQIYFKRNYDMFRVFGLTMFCGRQGSGKTVSMVNYANWIHQRYPKCIIVANFAYAHANYIMTGWRDLFTIRNGTDGVLFLIDEIHSEYSAKAWKDFPEELLSEISQQRKQRIKICATSQVYTRVVKQLREQTFSVVQCKTIGGRWTFNKEYDAKDYELYCESDGKKKLKPFNRASFVQSDDLRKCYDTYEKIERMSKMEFIDRHERGAG